MLPILFMFSALAGSNIVGGELAEDGDWPHLAAVGMPWGVQCTGVLIAPDLVLTAGHCAYGASFVTLNTTDHTEGGQTIDIEVATAYTEFATTLDIAVLQLQESTTISPVPLALDCIGTEAYIDDNAVTLVGYGKTDLLGETSNTQLYQVDMLIEDADCSTPDRGCRDGVNPGGELIAGGSGIDSCDGDSGGPLLVEIDGQFYLMATVSRAAQPASTVCGDGGIYIRVDAISDWIESTTSQVLPRPQCDGDENRPPQPEDHEADVEQGSSILIQLDPMDPDSENYHSWNLRMEPLGGATLSSSGEFLYQAPDTFIGDTVAIIDIMDNGTPPLSASMQITITVTGEAHSEPKTCSQGGNLESLSFLWLLYPVIRRRRRV